MLYKFILVKKKVIQFTLNTKYSRHISLCEFEKKHKDYDLNELISLTWFKKYSHSNCF